LVRAALVFEFLFCSNSPAESFRLNMQGIFEFCGKLPTRAAKPERLFFAAMPDDASAAMLTRFAERLILENDLAAQPLAPARAISHCAA
jgi:hypothetical protein